MATFTPKRKKQGGDLMLFVKDASNNYTSIAWAQNHTLNINSETQSYNSKDNTGSWQESYVNALSWEISADNTVSTDYDTLVDKMIQKSPIAVAFGGHTNTGSPADGSVAAWALDASSPYYSGNAIISSINLTANNGEYATFSVNLTGTGALTKHN